MSQDLSERISLHIVSGLQPWPPWDYGEPPDFNVFKAIPRDPNGRDGEWHAVVSLPHEVVERDGYGVPVFEGDVERIEWERKRAEG
jgi:hypothetical protein